MAWNPQRAAWILTFLAAHILDSSIPFFTLYAHAETKLITSVTASERYDSNVWFGPKAFVPPGQEQGDLVSAISPQVEVLIKNRQMDTSLTGGVSGNLYVFNPVLDYVSFNASVSSKLDGWINQYIEGARLSVADSFFYTPQPPAFLTGGQPPPTSDVLLRGIQGARANTFTNTASVSGSYDLARGFGVQADYSAAIFRVGQIFADVSQAAIPVAYFNTLYHDFLIGPTYTLTSEDSVALNYERQWIIQPDVDSLTTHGLIARYTKHTPYGTLAVNGGAVYLDQGQTLYFSGGLSLTGTYDPSTTIRVTLSRNIQPIFFPIGGAVISNLAGMFVERKLSRVLSFSVNGNYAVNTTVPLDTFTFTSIQGSAIFKYQLTRLAVASLSYEYYYTDIRSGQQSGGSSPGFAYNRHVVALGISATWK